VNLVLSGLDFYSDNIINESDHLMTFFQPHWLFSVEEPHGCKSRRPCPGFSWDGVNFHNKLVRLTQTANQMGYSIPCDVMLSI